MKKYINLFVLLPLYIFAMDQQPKFFQLPVTHRTEDYLSARKYPFTTVNDWSIEELSVKREQLYLDSDFQKELPLIINEANAFKEQLEGNACAKRSCVYGKCMVKAGAATCLAGYVATLTHNVDLGQWLCGAGLGFACYQCNTELKNSSRVRIDLQRKILLLEGAQLRASTEEILAELQQAIAEDPAQGDPYDFSYDEEN